MAPRKHRDILNGSKAVVVDRIAAILRTGNPTRFAHMAACKYGLRQAFIECGHTWALSDWCAERVVHGALSAIGARWPRWAEGQPEYTQDGHSPIERTRCIRCGGGLPEGHRRYCSDVCAASAHNWMYAKDHRAELAAYQRAYRAAQRAAAHPRKCEWCGGMFKPLIQSGKSEPRFCSKSCAAKHSNSTRPQRFGWMSARRGTHERS